MRDIILATLAIVAMVGCTKESNDGLGGTLSGDDVVKFASASIDTRVSTDGTMWSIADNIGITMFNQDATTLAETVATNSDNINYVSSNSAETLSTTFTVATVGKELLYPNTGKVKFYAYYPFQSTMADGTFTYSADVSDQSANIDFMVAEPITTSRTDESLSFVFSHKLSKITIAIKGNENVPDLTEVTVSAKGLSTKGSYSILSGSDKGDLSSNDVALPFVISNNTTTAATATAIILPETLSTTATVTFTLGSRSFKISIPTNTTFSAGDNHAYSVALGNDYTDFGDCTIVGWGDDVDKGELFSEEV